ncbi:MAG: hypothetical protein KC478_11595, partial [Bacteriovoracaceae bacterium]|nr:hypothetical protein [Bacteriovoracaceae bacterium]
ATILEKWLSEFLGELRLDFKLSIAAYAKNQEQVSNELANRQRYEFFCSEFDEIWLMTYDYSIPPWTGIGELAPLKWVNEVVDYTLTKCELSQVRVGLAAYGYDWSTNKTISELDALKSGVDNQSIEYLSKRKEKVKALKEKGIMKYFIWSLGMFDQAL